MICNVSFRISTFLSKKDFQKSFANQNLEQLFMYIFSISAAIIPHFTNIARGKGNSNINSVKNEIMMAISK